MDQPIELQFRDVGQPWTRLCAGVYLFPGGRFIIKRKRPTRWGLKDNKTGLDYIADSLWGARSIASQILTKEFEATQ